MEVLEPVACSAGLRLGPLLFVRRGPLEEEPLREAGRGEVDEPDRAVLRSGCSPFDADVPIDGRAVSLSALMATIVRYRLPITTPGRSWRYIVLLAFAPALLQRMELAL